MTSTRQWFQKVSRRLLGSAGDAGGAGAEDVTTGELVAYLQSRHDLATRALPHPLRLRLNRVAAPASAPTLLSALFNRQGPVPGGPGGPAAPAPLPLLPEPPSLAELQTAGVRATHVLADDACAMTLAELIQGLAAPRPSLDDLARVLGLQLDDVLPPVATTTGVRRARASPRALAAVYGEKVVCEFLQQRAAPQPWDLQSYAKRWLGHCSFDDLQMLGVNNFGLLLERSSRIRANIVPHLRHILRTATPQQWAEQMELRQEHVLLFAAHLGATASEVAMACHWTLGETQQYFFSRL